MLTVCQQIIYCDSSHQKNGWVIPFPPPLKYWGCEKQAKFYEASALWQRCVGSCWEITGQQQCPWDSGREHPVWGARDLTPPLQDTQHVGVTRLFHGWWSERLTLRDWHEQENKVDPSKTEAKGFSKMRLRAVPQEQRGQGSGRGEKPSGDYRWITCMEP